MLNTQNEETNTVFYTYVACFVNTLTLNMYVSMSFTGFTRGEYVIHVLVVAPQAYVNIYSTRRVSTRDVAEAHPSGEPQFRSFTRNTQHPHTDTSILTYESTLGLPTKPVY